MTIKAALLDMHGVYQFIDELPDESALTQHHLPQITQCDLPPGQYRWIADADNPYGGSFVSLKTLARLAESENIIANEQQRLDALRNRIVIAKR